MNILYPDRVFTEIQQAIPEGVRYSWEWQRDICSTRINIINPTPEQLTKIRKNLNVQKGK